MLNECIRRYFFPLSSQRNKEAKKKKKRLISGYLPICVSVSLYSTLSSYLILAVCRKCVTYEPSKWLGSLLICVSVSLYSTLSSLLIVEVCRTCVSLFTLFCILLRKYGGSTWIKRTNACTWWKLSRAIKGNTAARSKFREAAQRDAATRRKLTKPA